MNEKISEVCLTYGFKDYPSFFRAFRKAYGMSPKEYREAFSLSERIIREGGRKSYLFEAYRNFCNIYNNPVNSIFWLGLVIYIQQRKEQIKTAKTYSTQHQISIQ